MENSITWVGIDAHKETLAVAVMRDGSTEVSQSVIAHKRFTGFAVQTAKR